MALSRSHSGSRTLILQPKEETLTQAHETGKQKNNIRWILPSPLFTNGKYRPVITCESTLPQCWGSFTYLLFSLIQKTQWGSFSQSTRLDRGRGVLCRAMYSRALLICPTKNTSSCFYSVKPLSCETQRNASFSHSENQGESSWNILHKGVGGDFESLVWTYQRQIMPKHEGIFSNTLASENHIAPPAWYLTALTAKIYQQQSLTRFFQCIKQLSMDFAFSVLNSSVVIFPT